MWVRIVSRPSTAVFIGKVKVKAAYRGLFGTETCTVYCTLTPRNFLPSPLEALCISQSHSALC
jgi:hypothetical protein